MELEITEDEKTYMIIWLNVELRTPTLTQRYADILHGLYVKLVGSNHDVWDNLGGRYERDGYYDRHDRF